MHSQNTLVLIPKILTKGIFLSSVLHPGRQTLFISQGYNYVLNWPCLSSGGGYRAMIGLLGYIKAMKKTEIWDCIMYLAGVSGSCWTIATYYSSVSQTCPSRLERHFESKLNIHWANLSNFFNQLICTPQHSRVMLQGIIQRAYQRGGDLSFADIFGTLIGSTLLLPAITEPSKQQLGCNYLSKQSQYLSDGLEPMPIYSSVYHTEEEYDSYQWFEFTPYEMGCEDIEAWIPTWAFGRRFEQGTSKDRLTEQSMDTMLG
jgi:phospholipase A2